MIVIYDEIVAECGSESVFVPLNESEMRDEADTYIMLRIETNRMAWIAVKMDR